MDAVQFGLHYGIVCQNKDPDQLGAVKFETLAGMVSEFHTQN